MPSPVRFRPTRVNTEAFPYGIGSIVTGGEILPVFVLLENDHSYMVKT